MAYRAVAMADTGRQSQRKRAQGTPSGNELTSPRKPGDEPERRLAAGGVHDSAKVVAAPGPVHQASPFSAASCTRWRSAAMAVAIAAPLAMPSSLPSVSTATAFPVGEST